MGVDGRRDKSEPYPIVYSDLTFCTEVENLETYKM